MHNVNVMLLSWTSINEIAIAKDTNVHSIFAFAKGRITPAHDKMANKIHATCLRAGNFAVCAKIKPSTLKMATICGRTTKF